VSYYLRYLTYHYLIFKTETFNQVKIETAIDATVTIK